MNSRNVARINLRSRRKLAHSGGLSKVDERTNEAEPIASYDNWIAIHRDETSSAQVLVPEAASDGYVLDLHVWGPSKVHPVSGTGRCNLRTRVHLAKP